MLKITIALLLTFCLVGKISARGPTRLPPRCLAQVRCSNEENLIWAIDGRLCSVFLNPCFLLNENCSRLRRKRPQLREVSRPDCQRLCPQICTMEFAPVCAEYRGRRRQFGNRCQLNVHICRTGELYQFLFPRPCPPEPTVITT